MNKLWKDFSRLNTCCYKGMATGTSDLKIWNETFRAFVNALEAEREIKADFGQEYYELEDELDYRYDVTEWMEDYLDELDVREEYDALIEACNRILTLFQWKEDQPSDFKFRIASALGNQGKFQEAYEFCEEWYRSEADNILAATATVYARIGIREMDGAGEIIRKFITDSTVCGEENDIMYMAAETYYKVIGDKKQEKKISQALKRYEKELEEYFMSWDEEDGLDFLDEEDMPF